MEANASQLNDVRAKALKVIARMNEDPEFRDRVTGASKQALAEAGLSADDLATLRSATSAHAQARPDIWCSDTTCWSSECGPTCYVTYIWY